jgi:hypothetical protein
MGMYMKIGWKPFKVHNLIITFATITTNVGRFTNWAIDGESGDVAFFCSGWTIKNIGTN